MIIVSESISSAWRHRVLRCESTDTPNMSIYTANYQVEWKPGAKLVDITAYTLSVEGQFETTGANNGVAFGDSSSAAFSVTLDPRALAH